MELVTLGFMTTTKTKDAVAAFCQATRVNDIDQIVSTLAPNAELLSPLSGRMVFRGRGDLVCCSAPSTAGCRTWSGGKSSARARDPRGRQ
jgi:hypothetical protein